MQCLFRVTVVWEGFEFMYDIFAYPFFPELGKAQKGFLDTFIDVLVANLSGYSMLWFIKLSWHCKIKKVFSLFKLWGFTAKNPVGL